MFTRTDMHIGIDFDNTIVSYDDAFYLEALKLDLIGRGTAKNKQVIRDEIRKLPGGNDKWTELQGIVYGLHMDEAEMIEGVDRFLMKCKEEKVRVSIISQKTQCPAMGPRADLRKAARKWLEDRKFISRFGLKEGDIVFETTIKEKVERIAKKGCTHFIDDLPEVLMRDDFPKGIKRILFSRTEKCPSKDVLCFREWDAISDYFFVRLAADDLLWKASGERIVSFEGMPGAFNCSVYKAVTDKKRKYLVKRYNMKKNDKRDRLATEFGGLSFLWKNGLRSIPRPVAVDRSKNLAVYSFIEGNKIKGNEIKLKEVLAAAGIIGQMKKLSGVKGSSSQPVASEACFSLRAYLDIVESRMRRLEAAKDGGTIGNEMRKFVKDELRPFFRKMKKFVEGRSRLLNIDMNKRLSRKEMFLSPSDVGFHNILKGRSGKIYFIDFEYFGWDDPAKALSDFFIQPDSPMPVKFRKNFFKRIMSHFGNDRKLMAHFPMVYAILSVKWCQIILNAFLGNGIAHDTIVLKKQLDKARALLKSATREFKAMSFPLSLAKEATA